MVKCPSVMFCGASLRNTWLLGELRQNYSDGWKANVSAFGRSCDARRAHWSRKKRRKEMEVCHIRVLIGQASQEECLYWIWGAR